MLSAAFLMVTRLLICSNPLPRCRAERAEGAAAGAHLAGTGRGCAAAGCGLLLLLRGQEPGSRCSLKREVVTGACELPAGGAAPGRGLGSHGPPAPLACPLLPPHKLCNGASCLPAQGSCLWRLSRRAFFPYPAELLRGLQRHVPAGQAGSGGAAGELQPCRAPGAAPERPTGALRPCMGRDPQNPKEQGKHALSSPLCIAETLQRCRVQCRRQVSRTAFAGPH